MNNINKLINVEINSFNHGMSTNYINRNYDSIHSFPNENKMYLNSNYGIFKLII